MGLAAGINFSMRSVAITDTRYMAGSFEREVQPDELLQMFGRAGRRGLDETGYALVSDRTPRLLDARPRTLKRAAQVDWPTLIAVMQAATERGEEPFAAALELNRRLFTPHAIPLGIEHSRETGPMPCGLSIDMERARHARRGIAEMLNSRGEWEPRPDAATQSTLGEALVLDRERWRPALSIARTMEGRGVGNLCKLDAGRERRYGREVPIGTRRGDGSLALAPWLKRLLKIPRLGADHLQDQVLARLPELTGGGALVAVVPRGDQLAARLSYAAVPVTAWRDSHRAALVDPPERRELPPECRSCPELERYCNSVALEQSPAFLWRRLGLIDAGGAPTRRGIVFSFFHNGEGLAVAAGLEDEGYAIADLVFDLANIRAGPRFAGDESRWSGHLGFLCAHLFDRADIPGYLEMGVPLDYGAGASEAVRGIVEHGTSRHTLLTESLRHGDIERALIEWRSLLRHIVWAPDYDWPRWRALKDAAAKFIDATESNNLLALPELTALQRRRPER
jgi:hypothetical protein